MKMITTGWPCGMASPAGRREGFRPGLVVTLYREEETIFNDGNSVWYAQYPDGIRWKIEARYLRNVSGGFAAWYRKRAGQQRADSSTP